MHDATAGLKGPSTGNDSWRTVQLARQKGLVGVMRFMKALTGFRISWLKIGTGSWMRLRQTRLQKLRVHVWCGVKDLVSNQGMRSGSQVLRLQCAMTPSIGKAPGQVSAVQQYRTQDLHRWHCWVLDPPLMPSFGPDCRQDCCCPSCMHACMHATQCPVQEDKLRRLTRA
jgi:hypothetical protein